MRLISAFFMVMLLLSPILLRLGLLGHYQLNKAKITRLHCINRDKPAMHCEGKCYLQEQLEKAQREQQGMEGIFVGWDKWEEWLPPSLLGWMSSPPTVLERSLSFTYLSAPGTGFLFEVFRPPQVGEIWGLEIEKFATTQFPDFQFLNSQNYPSQATVEHFQIS
jgi:hypothetical protein